MQNRSWFLGWHFLAYLDIKAAFDSVDRRALWKALRSTGVPDILIPSQQMTD